jgi:predicted  nucleic acid-binding Zn-ribbon protein
MGFGGRGFRNRFFGSSTPQQTSNVSTQQELSGLKQQADFLHSELAEISRRIEQIEKTSAE